MSLSARRLGAVVRKSLAIVEVDTSRRSAISRCVKPSPRRIRTWAARSLGAKRPLRGRLATAKRVSLARRVHPRPVHHHPSHPLPTAHRPWKPDPERGTLELETLDDAREEIGRYHHRPRSRLNYKTPREVVALWKDVNDDLIPAA